MTGVPAHLQMLLDTAALTTADLRSLRNVLIAGSAAPPTLMRRVRQRICPVVVRAYGALEGAATFCLPHDPPDRSETIVGRPVPEVCEIRVVDDEGRDLEPRQVGEVSGSGPFAPLGCGLRIRGTEQRLTDTLSRAPPPISDIDRARSQRRPGAPRRSDKLAPRTERQGAQACPARLARLAPADPTSEGRHVGN